MPRPNLDQLRSIGDHAVLFRWNVLFSKFPVGLANGTPDLTQINLRAESSEQPSRAGQTIVTNIRGHQKKQTGIWTYNPITLTFVETEDNLITNFINDWIELSWSTNTGEAVPSSDLEANFTLQRLNNQDEPIAEFEIIGAKPEAEDKGGTLGGDTSDTIKPTITVQMDRFEYTSLV